MGKQPSLTYALRKGTNYQGLVPMIRGKGSVLVGNRPIPLFNGSAPMSLVGRRRTPARWGVLGRVGEGGGGAGGTAWGNCVPTQKEAGPTKLFGSSLIIFPFPKRRNDSTFGSALFHNVPYQLWCTIYQACTKTAPFFGNRKISGQD